MNNDVEKGKAGQFFEDFLKEQGALDETNKRAAKRMLAFQLAGETKQQCTAEAETARRQDAGRSETDLHPETDQ